MKKTLLSVSLAVGLLFTGGSGASAATVHYKDVKPGDNYYKAVESLLDQKAISRTLENFNPNGLVTRGQAASIIVKVLGISTENVTDPKFKDVPQSNQFYKYIAALQNEGIIGGKGDGTFGINQPLTRGQMASILVEGFEIPLIGVREVGFNGFAHVTDSIGGVGENSVLDGGDTRFWFTGQFGQAIETMHYYGYVSGYKNGKYAKDSFEQNNPLKRSQLALMVHSIQNGPSYEHLYFKYFDILNQTYVGEVETTDEIKIEDSSIIKLIDTSNYKVDGYHLDVYEKGPIKNEYAILEAKKEGTTKITFENSDKVVEAKVIKVDGKLKVEFKL